MSRTNDPRLTYDICTTVGPFEFVTEASTAGFPVGTWPSGVETTMGNKLPLMRDKIVRDDEGDIMYARYSQMNGCITVKVFND